MSPHVLALVALCSDLALVVVFSVQLVAEVRWRRRWARRERLAEVTVVKAEGR